MRRIPLAAVLLVGLIAAAAVLAEDAKKDLEQIKGTWTVEEFKVNGREAPKDVREALKMVFDGDKMTFGGGKGEEAREFTFKLDPDKKPKVIDTTALTGPYKGNTQAGIYKLDGDTLTICMSNDPKAKEAPADFESKEGSNLVLFTLKRAKP